MTAKREPFVSGLPDDRRALASAVAQPAGLAVLAHIRARALADSKILEPLCRDRFDGAERLQADPADIEAKAAYDATVALVDGIMADPVLQLRVAALLARAKT